MQLGLSGKIGIVTGASRGIGAAIAQELASEGCSLTLVARESDDLRQQAKSMGGAASVHPADLTDNGAVESLVDAHLARHGRIDFVICAASSSKMGDFITLSDADWHDGFELKFFAHMRLVRQLWPKLAESSGSVVFIVGAAGRTPFITSSITGSVNAALLNLTKSLALRGVKDDVQVNAINPGPTRTERFERRKTERIAARNISVAEVEKELLAESGAYRIGTPQDVAALAAFVISSRGRSLHGALLDIDGGKTKTL